MKPRSKSHSRVASWLVLLSITPSNTHSPVYKCDRDARNAWLGGSIDKPFQPRWRTKDRLMHVLVRGLLDVSSRLEGPPI
ncbi:Uncharacterized protein HZ326_3780 [Fusarium oxysporum f. sp. albedinis]|nr:Uncharacterized protein HZ326_3780 [Fusarium oxysporum f. sp. albedinis]